MSDNGFWNDDWMKVQQQYWRQWTELGMKALGGQTPEPSLPWSTGPWENAMNHWWQALSPATPEINKGFMDRMLDQGKMFFRMAEDMASRAGAGTDMSKAMEAGLNDMQKAFSGGMQGGDDALHKMMAFWEMPFDNWQRMVSSLSLTPGDALRNMPHDQVKDSLNQFLTAPGLGYSREEQSQYQDLIRRNLNYQKALQDYMQFFSNLGLKAVERMRHKLGQLDANEQVIDSARGLYNLWVSACEEVYAEQVMTPEYAAIHGKLVNALMALKRRMAVMVDETLGGLNMPTRTELRTLQDRLQETRRENKALRRDLEDLQEQVAALAQSKAPAPTPAATTKKTPVRRKTTKKKAVAKPADPS